MRKNILITILYSVFLVAFNALFFINAGFNHALSIRICYGFLHFAYLMVLITPFIEAKGKTAYLSKLTTYSISFLYFIIEFIFTLVIFYSEYTGVKTVISVEIFITAIYVSVLLINLLANDATANKQVRRDRENNFIKTSSAQLIFIESVTANRNLKNKINDLYRTLHSSPIGTSSDVTLYEKSIVDLLNKLESGVEKQDEQVSLVQLTEIERFVNKRNLILKADI